MKKKDFFIIGAALLAAGILYIATAWRNAPAAFVLIYVGSEVYAKVPIDEYQTITVEQDDGKVNVVTIDEKGVFMESANCKNQLCVRQGHVSLDKADALPLGRWIVCLPNGVTVELSEDGE